MQEKQTFPVEKKIHFSVSLGQTAHKNQWAFA